MSIFNSLGSNYSSRFVFKSLFGGSSAQARSQLEQELSKAYHGHVTLTYKGREALELALKRSNLAPDSGVGINGLTCFVVYQAIVNAGYRPVFIDTAPNQLDFGLNELTQAHSKHPYLQAIIVQNTLGYPVDMPTISSYCKHHQLLVIEDLAHSLGARYADNQEAGTVGALTMLSFSQDKPLDVVAGGALIDRRSSAEQSPEQLPLISLRQRLINRSYPFWTMLIRGSYSLGPGRVLHYSLKRLHLLATPMSDTLRGLHSMSPATATLLLKQWPARQEVIKHRQTIAALYHKNLPAELQLVPTPTGSPAYLRFPLWCDERQELISYLKQRGVYVGDTWYDAPIAPKRYLSSTDYQTGMCPQAEDLAEHILNLPTHRYVTPQIAHDICATIRQWHASRPKT